MFEKEFSVPVTLVNDANAGALAEWRWGAGRGKSDVIFLTCGTGMGAGIISGGRLIAGAMGNAGEIGHVRLSTRGPMGYGKEGSVEGWTSGGGLGRLAISKGWPAGTDAKAVVEAAQLGDEKAKDLLRHMGGRLGETLAILIDLFNPQCITLGSFYIRAQPFLEPSMREVLAKECLAESLSACEVVPAKLGERIGDCQALAAALQSTPEGK
jgi:glucokinase